MIGTHRQSPAWPTTTEVQEDCHHPVAQERRSAGPKELEALCTDYKILSKVQASRLREVMGSVVPGRLMSDNVTLIQDVLRGLIGC